MRQHVEIAMYDKECTRSQEDKYVFNPAHKCRLGRWLQAKVWSWLYATGAVVNTYREEMAYTRIVLSDTTPNLDNIHRAIADIRREFNLKPGHLYLGREAAEKMHLSMGSEPQYYRIASFEAQQIMGVPFSVLPWMEGWVIVPEDKP